MQQAHENKSRQAQVSWIEEENSGDCGKQRERERERKSESWDTFDRCYLQNGQENMGFYFKPDDISNLVVFIISPNSYK